LLVVAAAWAAADEEVERADAAVVCQVRRARRGKGIP
jgi:hypothetical protein